MGRHEDRQDRPEGDRTERTGQKDQQSGDQKGGGQSGDVRDDPEWRGGGGID